MTNQQHQSGHKQSGGSHERGGSSEQHAAADRQNHKNRDEDTDSKKSGQRGSQFDKDEDSR